MSQQLSAHRKSQIGNDISNKKRIAGFKAISAVAKRLKLATADVKPIVGSEPNDPSKANISESAKESSLMRYESVWEQFTDFCIKYGDHSSALLTCRSAGVVAPYPPNYVTVILFARYRTYKKGEPLLHPLTNQPVRFKGEKMFAKCRGDWTSVSTLSLLRSSLSKLSNHYDDCRGAYIKPCADCIALQQKGKKHGCERRHKSHPQLLPSGNVSDCQEVKNHFEILKKYIADNYENKSTIAYFPSELRDMRKYCIFRNVNGENLKTLQLWTIVICASKLMLRIKEIRVLKVEDFMETHATIKDNLVENLLFCIRGKCDKTNVHLLMWNDKVCPDLCPVKALLIYVAITGLKSGYLFPEDLRVQNTGVGVKPIAYNTILNRLKSLTSSTINRSLSLGNQSYIIGTHALRRTGLLLACWHFLDQSNGRNPLDDPMFETIIHKDARADGALGTIVNQMRHSNQRSTQTYLSDVAALHAQAKTLHPNNPQFKVGPHRSIYLQHLQKFLGLIKNENKKSLSELADWFVFEIGGVPRNNCLEKMTVSDVFESCFNAESAELRIPPNISESHKFLIEKIGMTAYQTFIEKEKEEQEIKAANAADSVNSPSNSTSPTVGNATNNDSNLLTLNRDYYGSKWESCSNISDKIDVCMEAYNEAKELCVKSGKKMSIKGKQCLMYRQLYNYGRICECIRHCFRGNEKAFAAKFDGKNLVVSKFACAKGGKKHSPNFKTM